MARKNKKRGPTGHRKAQLRFAVIGGLLSSPAHPGNLAKELDLLAEKHVLAQNERTLRAPGALAGRDAR